jgi:dephospho-CoA kinase
VVETPLLFEAGMDGAYDATVAVIADEDVRAARAGGARHAAVDERAARQLPQEEKAARATFVVRNSAPSPSSRRSSPTSSPAPRADRPAPRPPSWRRGMLDGR